MEKSPTEISSFFLKTKKAVKIRTGHSNRFVNSVEKDHASIFRCIMRVWSILCISVLLCEFVILVTLLYMTTIRKPVAKTYCFNSPTFGNRDAGLQQTQERQDLLVPNADANEEQRTRLKPPRDLLANKEQWPQRKATLDGTKSTTESADLTILVNDEVKRQPPAASSTRRKNLLILSQARSGSSLLGELFNNHPSIMYVFEPLHNLHYVSKRSNVSFKTETDSYGLLCNKILDSFFKCDFSNITNVLPLYSTTILSSRW